MAGFRDRAPDPVELSVVPYLAVTVLIDLSEGLQVDDGTGSRAQGSVALGLAPRDVRGGGQGIEILQLRLSPTLAYAVLGASAESSGTVVGLEDLWGCDATRIQERLCAAATWEQRFAIAEAALARRHETGWQVDREVASAWKQMTSQRGQVRVDALAAEVGWSRKRLWSRFRSQIGLTPKRAARLVRFDYATRRLVAGDSAAAVAVESGYVDQSHLHRDIMAFAGMTPATVAVAPWLAVDDVAWPAHRADEASVGCFAVA